MKIRTLINGLNKLQDLLGGVWMCLFRGAYCLSHFEETKKQKVGVWMCLFKRCLSLLPRGDKSFLISQFGMAFEKQLINLYN